MYFKTKESPNEFIGKGYIGWYVKEIRKDDVCGVAKNLKHATNYEITETEANQIINKVKKNGYNIEVVHTEDDKKPKTKPKKGKKKK